MSLFSVSSMECDTTSVTELETKLTKNMVEYYLQIADSARLQVGRGSCGLPDALRALEKGVFTFYTLSNTSHNYNICSVPTTSILSF